MLEIDECALFLCITFPTMFDIIHYYENKKVLDVSLCRIYSSILHLWMWLFLQSNKCTSVMTSCTILFK